VEVFPVVFAIKGGHDFTLGVELCQPGFAFHRPEYYVGKLYFSLITRVYQLPILLGLVNDRLQKVLNLVLDLVFIYLLQGCLLLLNPQSLSLIRHVLDLSHN